MLHRGGDPQGDTEVPVQVLDVQNPPRKPWDWVWSRPAAASHPCPPCACDTVGCGQATHGCPSQQGWVHWWPACPRAARPQARRCASCVAVPQKSAGSEGSVRCH